MFNGKKLKNNDDNPVFRTSLKDKYKCPICKSCVREPQHVIACGHIFCKNCFHEYQMKSRVNKGRRLVCPVDKKIIKEGRVFTDLRLQGEIDDLEVYCKNKDLGCEAICELRNYQKHIWKCGYNMVSCPLECGEEVRYVAIQKHQSDECRRRPSSCVVCNQEMEYCILKDEHERVCPMKEVPCDFCGTKVVMKEMDDHYNTVCASYPAFCIFAPLGCKEKMRREDLESHHDVSTRKHLSMVSAATLNMYKTLGVKLPECKIGEKTVPYELPVQLRSTMSENNESASLFGVVSGEREHEALLKKMNKIEMDNESLQEEVEMLKVKNSLPLISFRSSERNLEAEQFIMSKTMNKIERDNEFLLEEVGRLKAVNRDVVRDKPNYIGNFIFLLILIWNIYSEYLKRNQNSSQKPT